MLSLWTVFIVTFNNLIACCNFGSKQRFYGCIIMQYLISASPQMFMEKTISLDTVCLN